MNWYKKNTKIAYTPGGMEPVMDKYDKGHKPPSTNHKEEFNGKVTANPFLGTNIRGIDHHRGTSRLEPDEDKQQIRQIPSEPILMDQDPPTGEGVNKEQFVPEEDKKPMGGISKMLDRGVSPTRRNIYKKLREEALFRPINRI